MSTDVPAGLLRSAVPGAVVRTRLPTSAVRGGVCSGLRFDLPRLVRSAVFLRNEGDELRDRELLWRSERVRRPGGVRSDLV